MTPEAATTSDSSDSLMNELKNSRKQSRNDPEEGQIGGEDSSDNAVRGPRRARRVLKRDSSPVVRSEDLEHGNDSPRDLNDLQSNGEKFEGTYIATIAYREQENTRVLPEKNDPQPSIALGASD